MVNEVDEDWAVLFWDILEFEFSEKKSKDIQKSVIKLLAFHSVQTDEENRIVRVGLSKYDLSNKNLILGMDEETEESHRVKKKPSYSNLVDTIIPNMTSAYVIREITQIRSHSGQKIPLYGLTYNGLIFALLFCNKEFQFTDFLISKFFEMKKYFGLYKDDDPNILLLNNFRNLEKDNQKKLLEYYINEFVLNSNEEEEDKKEKANIDIQWLYANATLGYFYFFFLAPVKYCEEEELLIILREFWQDYDKILGKNLITFIQKSFESYRKFEKKLELSKKNELYDSIENLLDKSKE